MGRKISSLVPEQTIDAKKKCAKMSGGNLSPKRGEKRRDVRCCGRMEFGQFGEATFKFALVSASL
jgi:hypothetical protein